jgi:uncharacterized membrane protein
MGWTVNFANKKSLLVFIAIMVITIILIALVPHKQYHL